MLPIKAVSAQKPTQRPSWFGLSDISATTLLAEDLLDIDGQFIIDFNLAEFANAGIDLTTISTGDLATRLGLPAEQVRSVQRRFLNSAVVTATPQQAAALATNPLVAIVHANTKIKAAGESRRLSWGLDRLDSPSLPLDGRFDRDTGEYKARVYMFDSGSLPSRTEFGPRIIARANFTRRTAEDLASCVGHGTEMASLIMGRTTGSAPKAALVDLVILPCERDKTGESASLVEAAEWLLISESEKSDGQPVIANMSLIGKWSQKINNTVAALTANGVVVVVAAGNNAEDACRFSPASARDAITVAATGPSDETPHFSNFGQCVKVNAPGVKITALTGNARAPYAAINGTSGAAALVSGLLARSLNEKGVASAGKWLLNAALPPKLWRKAVADIGLAQINDGWRKLCRTTNLPDGAKIKLHRTPGGKPIGTLGPEILVSVDQVEKGWTLVKTSLGKSGWVASTQSGSETLLRADENVKCTPS